MLLPKVPWTTKLGDRAEAEIEARLNHFSDPRKLMSHIAVDFYCELLKDRTAFYVQAKGTRSFRKTWSRSLPKSTVAHWLLSLKHPVMLVVYDDKAGICYWKSIESSRYEFLPRVLSDSKKIPITLDRSKVLANKPNANDAFIAQIKADEGSIMLWLGYPQFEGKGYVKKGPRIPRSRYELANAEGNLMATSYSLARYYKDRSHDWPKARDLAEFLTKFDRSHYNQFVMLAQIQEVQGDRQAALLNWKEALNICERDKTWPKKSMDRLREAIKKEIERVEASLRT